MTPDEIARSERWEARSPWHRGRRMIKLHFGTIEKWKKLARRLQLTEEHAVYVLLELYVELVMQRRTWLSGQELAARLAPGAAAFMAHYGLAENRNGQVVLLDVERTVSESLVRRNIGLRSLPAKKARDLLGKMVALYEATRGEAYVYGVIGMAHDQQVLELLRSRANDRTILAAWKKALLSNALPAVKTLADLNRTWAQHQP